MIYAFLATAQSKLAQTVTRLQLTHNVRELVSSSVQCSLKLYRMPVDSVDSGAHDMVCTYSTSNQMVVISRSSVSCAMSVVQVQSQFEDMMLVKWKKGGLNARLQCRMEGSQMMVMVDAGDQGQVSLQIMNVFVNGSFTGHLYRVEMSDGDTDDELEFLEDNCLNDPSAQLLLKHVSSDAKGHSRLLKDLKQLNADCMQVTRDAMLMTYLLRECKVI